MMEWSLDATGTPLITSSSQEEKTANIESGTLLDEFSSKNDNYRCFFRPRRSSEVKLRKTLGFGPGTPLDEFSSLRNCDLRYLELLGRSVREISFFCRGGTELVAGVGLK